MEYSQTTTADFASLFSTKTLRYGDKIILGQKEKEVCKNEEVANLFNNIASVFNSYFYQGSFYGCLLVSFLWRDHVTTQMLPYGAALWNMNLFIGM